MKILILILSVTFLSAQYDFNLEDLNPNSQFYGQNIGPNDFEDQVLIVYFGHFNWGLCTTRFGQLNSFYEDLIVDGYEDYIKLFGVGKTDHLSNLNSWINGNNAMISADNSTWTNWGASQRDLYVIDNEGALVYNQSISSGIDSSVYSLIEQILQDMSNQTLIGDINSDGSVDVIDVVQLVSFILNETDVDGADISNDGLINVIDVVALINIILSNN